MIQYCYIENNKIVCNEIVDGYEYLMTKNLIKKGLTKKVNSIDELKVGNYFVLIETRK